MASKQLAPLNLPNLLGPPLVHPGEGFLKVYMKNGWFFKTDPQGLTLDIVLDRPLRGFELPLTLEPITRLDTVLSGIAKLQQSMLRLKLIGDVTGQAEYENDTLVIHTTVISDSSQTLDVTDYNYSITGDRTELTPMLFLSKEYVPGTLKVYLNGMRLTRGNYYDYREGTSNILVMNYPLEPEDLLIADYKTNDITTPT